MKQPCSFVPNRAFFLACVLGLSSPFAAQAQTQPKCGEQVKLNVLAQLSEIAQMPETSKGEKDGKIAQEDALYKQTLANCAEDALPAPTKAFTVAVGHCATRVPFRGSLFYEEMSCCGYDPQRRAFACPIQIKQNFGFGGSPLPGSREYVVHCVADNAGILRPVGTDSVHLSNSTANPRWQFAVVANAIRNLHLVQPMNGLTRRARSILSWGFDPINASGNVCNFVPVWGNALDYRIRLDQ